jgi:hypothetical protein
MNTRLLWSGWCLWYINYVTNNKKVMIVAAGCTSTNINPVPLLGAEKHKNERCNLSN